MSGIYLTLWDKELKDKSVVLHPVKSGWAHITVAYTDKLLPVAELVKIAQQLLPQWAMKEVRLQAAYVNTFQMIPSGVTRHDVLISLSGLDTENIGITRETYLSPYDSSNEFVMRTPHTTHSIHDNRESAEATAEMLNREHLPRTVRVTGVTID
jgi:hypothetical protein